MDAMFMNSKNRKTYDPHRLMLNLSDKIELKRSDKYAALSNLSIYYIWKKLKSYIKTINLTWWVIFCIRYSRLL